MSDAKSLPLPPARSAWWRRAVRDNPIVLKELRSRMRGRRAFLVLTLYLLILSLMLALIYWAYTSGQGGAPGATARDAGKVVLATVVAVQMFLVALIGPSFTAGAISSEKESRTYELLRTTLLTPSHLVLGKLISALSYVALLLITSLPLQGIALLLGGVDLIEVVLSQLVLLVAAVVYALVGLYASAVARSTLSASVWAYLLALGLMFALPFLALILVPVTNSLPLASSPTAEIITAYLLILAAGVNLPAALVVSDIFLVQEGSLWVMPQTVGATTIYLPSPWYLFIVIYSLLAWLLFRLCVRRVARPAD